VALFGPALLLLLRSQHVSKPEDYFTKCMQFGFRADDLSVLLVLCRIFVELRNDHLVRHLLVRVPYFERQPHHMWTSSS
jgi:hypothetical protein